MDTPEYKMDNDLFKKEIDLIQDVIKRMASNSFLIKGWMVTLVLSSVALNKDGANTTRLFLALIPLTMFWILDGYFLRQERLFRKLYNWVILERPKSKQLMFDTNVGRFINDVPGLVATMFSQTLFVFYGITFIMISIYMIVLLK